MKLFYRSLRQRLGTAPRERLANQLNTSPRYVSRMINGAHRSGTRWTQLLSLLTPEERELIEPITLP